MAQTLRYANSPAFRNRVSGITARRFVPGTQHIVWALYLTYAISLRLFLLHWHLPINTRLVSQIGNLLVLALVIIGFLKFIGLGTARQLSYPRLRVWTIFWVGMVALQLCFGLISGNYWFISGRETISLLYFSMFLNFGVDDRVWFGLQKHLTALFYITVPIILVFYETPAPRIGIDDMTTTFKEVSAQRYSGSMGHQIRFLLKPALFLTMWGLVRNKGGIMRILQVLAVPFYFIIEVGLFKFRSQAVLCMGVFIVFILLRPFLEHRIRPKTSFIIIAVCLSGLAFYITTDSFNLLYKRAFVYTEKSSMLESRDAELKVFLSQLNGLDIAVGRGMGGDFDAFNLYQTRESHNWRTLHYGVLIFLLKGGVGLLLLFLFIMQNSIRLRPRFWYQNPCNLTAALLMPLYLIIFLFIPFDLKPEAQIANLPAMLVFSRFFRIIAVDSRNKRYSVKSS